MSIIENLSPTLEMINITGIIVDFATLLEMKSMTKLRELHCEDRLIKWDQFEILMRILRRELPYLRRISSHCFNDKF